MTFYTDVFEVDDDDNDDEPTLGLIFRVLKPYYFKPPIKFTKVNVINI